MTGQWLGVLGASGLIVGLTAGLGEAVAYGLRLVSARLSDKYKKYWFFVFLGYGCNLLALPFMGLVSHWPLATGMVMTERFGKAVRSPSRDALLSCATEKIGHGKGFGLHGAIDQAGAVLSPVLLAGILALTHRYDLAFGVLAIPVILCMVLLVLTRRQFTTSNLMPADAMEKSKTDLKPSPLPRSFWLLMLPVGLLAAGTADFAILGFDLHQTRQMSESWIPLLYALAMLGESVGSFVIGHQFDTHPVWAVLVSGLCALCATWLVLLSPLAGVIVGMVCWGLGMCIGKVLLKAIVAHTAPVSRRAWAFGVFHTVFGVSWLAGSALLGVLLDVSRIGLCAVSSILLGAGVVLLVVQMRRMNQMPAV